jgi:hypothetical protein
MKKDFRQMQQHILRNECQFMVKVKSKAIPVTGPEGP